MKEFKPRDKLTQRMTRDGAVLDNQTTGAEIHISERDAEKQLSPDRQPVQMGKRDAPMNPAEDAPKHGRQLRPQEQKEPEKEQPKPQQPSAEPFQPQGGSPISHIPQDIPTSAAPGGTAEKLIDRAAAEHDAHKARQTARMSSDAAQQRYSASRLRFSEEERAAPELHKHIHRAEKAADKLDAAQAAIPKKRVLRKERVFDEVSGTAKTKLRFDTVDKSPPKLKPNPLGRPLREVAVQAHGKIHEVEHENVGVESGHKAEELAEHGAGGAIRWERRHRKLKPYGYHHSTDDGKYLIMGNGTQAFAIAAEQREQENYMRTAELSTEQNYNMIDGQINNTPSVDELEEKAKRGEVISLSALAAAVKAEDGRTPQRDPDGKKPSIRAQLKADRAQSCKPQQREKEQEAKRSIRQALEME